MAPQIRFRRLATAVLTAATLSIHPANAFPNSIQSEENDFQPQRRLEIAEIKSDEYATTTLNLLEPPPSAPKVGISKASHARITSKLLSAKQLMEDAKMMFMNPDARSMATAQEMMKKAGEMFQEAKDNVHHQEKNEGGEPGMLRGSTSGGEDAADQEERMMQWVSSAKSKYSSHDLRRAQEDEDRAVDVARNMWETFITFPECLDQLFERCVEIINNDLSNLGLSTIEVLVHEKRNLSQAGYNKVVIITNDLADTVKGRGGDGIVSYPFPWEDKVLGSRILGVDGKWDCRSLSPEDCCDLIKQSVPNEDVKGNHIECHIFVPYGGIGNARRNDRVIINLSPDGRVHEAPLIS